MLAYTCPGQFFLMASCMLLYHVLHLEMDYVFWLTTAQTWPLTLLKTLFTKKSFGRSGNFFPYICWAHTFAGYGLLAYLHYSALFDTLLFLLLIGRHQMEYTLVSQINPTRHNWTIKVRVARMWKVSWNPKATGVTGMELLLVDEEVCPFLPTHIRGFPEICLCS